MARRRTGRRGRSRRLLSPRRVGSTIGWLLAVAVYAFFGEPARRSIWPEGAFEGRVARVVDGDTFHVEGVGPPVRLWGVDAPERDEDGFFEAGAALVQFVRGRTLRCEIVDRDRYGRVVARCRRDDGADVSRLMIESGAAAEYWRYTQGRYAIERLTRAVVHAVRG